MQPAIILSDLSFAWPDGATAVSDRDITIGTGRTGLVGANGSGKSTLLRLVAGSSSRPEARSRSWDGSATCRRTSPLTAAAPSTRCSASRPPAVLCIAIERGEVHDDLWAAVGDDWDIEERARAGLDQLGLAHIGLDRRVGEVSGGEAVLIGLTAQVLQRPDVLLLDEPTNNLDRPARERLYGMVSAWTGLLVVVSHDRDLLDLMDQIVELRNGGVRTFGGNFTAYEETVAAEQETATRLVRAAESDRRRQQRELIEARVKLDRRKKYGQKMWDNKREPKIVMGARKRAAEVSAGKHLNGQLDRLAEAQQRLRGAEEAIRADAVIRIDLPGTTVPAGRTVLVARDAVLRNGLPVELAVRGPERIALVGANGSGKTTLLQTIVGLLPGQSGAVDARVPVAFLPQRLDILDDVASVVDNVRRFAPGAGDNAARALLARFLFRGAAADQIVGSLSGGERFRATLAALLLAEPPPQLLLLDEPTNNLDLASVGQLEQALESYRGALIVASHDLRFLRSIGITRWLKLADAVHEVDPC